MLIGVLSALLCPKLGLQVGNGLDSQNAGYLGSELKDRGDRIAFLGDAHAAQAVALVAFGNYALLNNSNQYGTFWHFLARFSPF